ncbi:hypothetical protein H5V45_07620 [Nocardioides sp. KIGAM211]|uniref:Uncharacterized protein n=1 Tax=Nocardioides luti TaxID=2761101 RepID=A0A7X0RHL6_9ACTN|nr:hypothetical protein [Nocardioides luti]MBB6627188.1 hypothetical protein [Nocardioides luti]
MTAPVPEEYDGDRPDPSTGTPPGEHSSDLPDGDDDRRGAEEQAENAETSTDQPSQ